MSETVARGLFDVATTAPEEWSQSLADGAPGIALSHIERARNGLAGWEPVHHLARAMTSTPVHAHPDVTNLFRGAPAVAYALHTAGHPAYRTALATLDASIAKLVCDLLDNAHRRIDSRRSARAREYDLINGLTGFGAYFIHRDDGHDLLRKVLEYLVRLTEPVNLSGTLVPGWWASGSPDRHHSSRWDGGHAGFGVAHGISGPLALLSAAMRQEVVVHGHRDAILAICVWLDRWQTSCGQQTWWPEVIDRQQLQTGTVPTGRPLRPSWCYGTPGIARAQQLAALAVGDAHRAHAAERALRGCLTDDHQLALLTDSGLCHGWAGLVRTARCAAADAVTYEIGAAADVATKRMRRQTQDHGGPTEPGLLEGTTGIDLVEAIPPDEVRPRWDTCLLINSTPP